MNRQQTIVVMCTMGSVVLACLIMALTLAFRAGRAAAPPSITPDLAAAPIEAPVQHMPPPPPRTIADVAREDAMLVARLSDDALAVGLEDWANHATDVTYAQLQRNADAFSGEPAVFQGRVEEIHDYPSGTMLRLGTGSYSQDVLWVETSAGCTADRALVERSRARVYGYLAGVHTYETQAGWTMTIPALLAIAVVPASVPRHVSARTRAQLGLSPLP